MNKFLLTLFFLLFIESVHSQDFGFNYGKVNVNELQMKFYPKDSTANALILNEFGNSSITNENFHLIHQFHSLIKIFNSKGFEQANFSIPIHKTSGRAELLKGLKASTFNLENGKIVETKFNGKFYTENVNKNWDILKFTLPSIKEGSIIEVAYTLESPFLYNFRKWDFQSEIPKLQSEYWTSIPGNYVYNIALKGPFKLAKNEVSVLRDCFTSSAGGKADCTFSKYVMMDIPAFKEEAYMTAKTDFLASINYELAEVRDFNGKVDKLTKSWNDADQELRIEPKFGGQLRRGKELFKDDIITLVSGKLDSLQAAQKIFNIIKSHYKWNERFGIFSDLGIKKAFEERSGNIGDINLSLIAALNYAGFKTDPILLSTRENGTPIDLYPVISDFNYVIAQVKINNKMYFLDASDNFLPFGTLPIRCLNGKGRVIPFKGPSYWTDVKPTQKDKRVTYLDIALQNDGTLKGKMTLTSYGYDALSERKKIKSFNTQDAYIEEENNKLDRIKINKYVITNLDDLEKNIIKSYEVEIEGYDNLNNTKLLLDPFFIKDWSKNPFSSKDRFYPVNLGMPIETQYILTLTYPSQFELKDTPTSIAVALPNEGGKFMLNFQIMGNKVIVTNNVFLNKPIYSPDEYHYLKELFAKIIQSYNTTLIFNKNI
ncbi:DUF3858 domain-containing protein [Adhaeribacter aquaticus]|uniref:DUF3858 domain-containing protein n=1 Tax=Adhaeribacter aquaticus TaxID=299567 RepID=UPI0003FC0C25|nr:DUF3858 domain-containing protein [Adhaeribacter aquaticus]